MGRGKGVGSLLQFSHSEKPKPRLAELNFTVGSVSIGDLSSSHGFMWVKKRLPTPFFHPLIEPLTQREQWENSPDHWFNEKMEQGKNEKIHGDGVARVENRLS